LNERKLVIATRSPARLALLNMLGIDYMAIEPNVKEEYGGLGPRDTVLNNAMRKAMSVVALAPENSVIVGFDTIVIDKSYRIIGKPKTLQFLSTVLRDLSGSWHKVVTGAYLIDTKDNTTDSFVEETRVKFKELTEEEIKLYMASMEGLGRAGG
jgi:septum formation protein